MSENTKTLVWGETGKRYYEAGVDKGVLFVWDDEKKAYGKGVVWDGLTSVPESPEGADANPYYADNIKYLNIIGTEDFKTTIGAYYSPAEFDECDGSAEIAPGVYAGQQSRKRFCFSWQHKIGSDTNGIDQGYVIHIAYNCTASPTEREHSTINENVEPSELSWDVTTTPVDVPGYKPTAHIKIDSTRCSKEKLAAFEKILYGDTEDPRCPMPAEIIQLLGNAVG